MNLPWFKLYAAETLSDSNFQSWTVDERGAWLTLLLVCWREGSIPSDQESLAKLLHVDGSTMRLLWSAIGSRFVEHLDHPGRLTSPRLEMEREESEKLAKKKSAAGLKGANSRWNKRNRADSKRMRLPCDDDARHMATYGDQDQIRSDQIHSKGSLPVLITDRDAWKSENEARLEAKYGKPLGGT